MAVVDAPGDSWASGALATGGLRRTLSLAVMTRACAMRSRSISSRITSVTVISRSGRGVRRFFAIVRPAGWRQLLSQCPAGNPQDWIVTNQEQRDMVRPLN